MGRVIFANQVPVTSTTKPHNMASEENGRSPDEPEKANSEVAYHGVPVLVPARSARKRKFCKLCLFLKFSKDALSEQALGRYARARFYNKQASFYGEDIKNATRLSVLHPCSTEHHDLMMEIRKAATRAFRATEIAPRALMLDNAQKDYERALQNYATFILTHALDSDEVVKASWWVTHYRAIRAQRRRRLNEAKGR